MNAWQQIQPLIEKAGVSSRELANIAGVVPSAVTKWKAGASIRNDALSRIAVHFGVSTDWLVTGRDEPRLITPQILPPNSAADPAVARRLAAPAHTLTQRERVIQMAAAGYDSARGRHKAAQYETLLQHVAGVAESAEEYDWHRSEIGNIIDKHFPKQSDKQAGEKSRDTGKTERG